MTSGEWLLAIGMAVVTFLPRVLPILLLNDREVSADLRKWLSFIPVAIFSALVFSDIFFWNEAFNARPFENLKLLPSLIVFFVAYKTKKLFVSVIVGIIAISLMVYSF